MSADAALVAPLRELQEPELRRSIVELGMVKGVSVGADGIAHVGVYLTVAGCPMRETITTRVTAAVEQVAGVRGVRVELDVTGAKAEPLVYGARSHEFQLYWATRNYDASIVSTANTFYRAVTP